MPIALWQLGLVLVTITTFTSAIGLLLFKRSADIEAHLPIWKRWRWWCGFFLSTVLLAVMDSIAYALTPLSLIAPFAGLTIVWSALLSSLGWFGFNEHLTRSDLSCTALVITGVTLVSVSASHNNDPEPSLSELRDDFRNPLFLAYASISALLVVAWLLVSLSLCLERYRPSKHSALMTFICAYCAAACGSLTQVFMKTLSTVVRINTTGESRTAFLSI